MGYLQDTFTHAVHLLISLDKEIYLIAWTSLKVSGAACLLAAIVGIPLGLWIGVSSFPGRGLVVFSLNTLMAMPTVVIGLLLYALLGRQGPLGTLDLLYTPAGIIVGEFLLALPIICNLTLTAIQGADPRLFLTCKALGANRRQEAWLILTELRFAVMAAVVTGFGRVIAEVGIAMMVGGNIKGLTRTMTTAIALETNKGEFELGLALGILLLSLALMVNALLYYLQRSPHG